MPFFIFVFILCFSPMYTSGQSNPNFKKRVDSLQKAFDTEQDTQKLLEIIYLSSKNNIKNIEVMRYEDCEYLLNYYLSKVGSKEKTDILYAQIQFAMGIIYTGFNEKKHVALEFFLKSLPALETNNTEEYLQTSYCFIGKIFYELENFEEAKKYTIKAKNRTSKGTVTWETMDTDNTLGLICQKKKEYDSALVYFDKSLTQAVKMSDSFWIGLVKGNIGTVYYLQKKYEKALEFLQYDIETSLQYSDYQNVMLSMSDVLSIYLEINEMEKARQTVEKLFEIAQKISNIDVSYRVLSKYCEAVSKYFEKIKDFEKAFSYNKKYQKAQQTIEKQRNLLEVERLKFKYDYDLKQQKLATLTSENNKQRLFIYVGVISLIILVLLVIFLTLLYKQKYHLNDVLHQHNQELKHINAGKDKIFSLISHDLRSPLASLKNVMELVRKEDISLDELKEILPTIEANVDYTFNLSEELLYWAKSQIQGLQTTPTHLNSKHIVQQSIASLKKIAEEKNIQLESSLTSDALNVWADEDMIKAVLRNFIVNAIKFSEAGKKVLVMGYEFQGNKVRFAVKDEGTGIKPENLSKIFKQGAFTTQGTEGEKGTGFGLLMCKDFIELNGGEIGVVSIWGKGSEFYFTLPKKL